MRNLFLIGLLPIAMLVTVPAYAVKTLVIIQNNNVVPTPREQQLISASPYDKEVLASSPPNVTLTFSQPIRPEKSRIKLYDMYGYEVDVGPLTSTGKDMSVDVPPLASGRYSVKWRARCRCDEDTDLSDSFHFTVR